MLLFCVCSQFEFGIKIMGSTNQQKISAAFLVIFARAFESKHLRKWWQTLTTRQNSENSGREPPFAGSNSINTSNSISSSSSDCISSVMDRTQSMIQASSLNLTVLDPRKSFDYQVWRHYFMNYKPLDTALKINVFTVFYSDYIWYVRGTWVRVWP